MKALDRLLQKAQRSDGCWIWRGAVNRGAGGYGWFRLDGEAQLAHRASWILHNGPIPDGMHVLHKCDVRLCVNPAHLFLGTNADNVADKVGKGRVSRGEGHMGRFTEEQIRAMRASTGTTREIASRFETSSSYVSAVKRGKYWRHTFES